MSARPLGSDRGETLLELIVALAIMSVAVVAVVGALATSVMMSDIHRKQATAGMALRDYAETITQLVDAGHYPAACAAMTTAYIAQLMNDADLHPVPTGYTATVLSSAPNQEKFWDGSAWKPACASDTGLRQITLQVASADGRATEKLLIEVRKPCSLSEALCS